jgi:hypothetical protein
MAPVPKKSPVDVPTLFSGSTATLADDTMVMGGPPFGMPPGGDTLLVGGSTLPLQRRDSGRPSAPYLVRAEPLRAVPVAPEAPPSSDPMQVTPEELIGTGPRAKVTDPPLNQQVGNAFVKAYRVTGFVILAAILGGLGTYVGTHLFFLFNRSWIAPTILSPADTRVLSFASHFVEESARKDALLVQRADVEMRRRDAERSVAIEKAFQSAYVAAMREDLSDRKADLARAKNMLGSYSSARRSIASAGEAFRSSSEQTLQKEFAAGVIDKTHLLGENLQLAQIADARLSLDARNVELQTRISALSRMVDSLDSAVNAGGSATSYEVLKIRAEFDRSIGAAAKASDELEATTKSVAMIDETLQAEERIIAMMQRSAFYGITGSRAVFAFVPYDNASSAKEGQAVYACRVGIVWCRKVGKLGAAAEGEIVEKHPLLHQDLRGSFVRIQIDDPSAAENAVLHVGRRPLFI